MTDSSRNPPGERRRDRAFTYNANGAIIAESGGETDDLPPYGTITKEFSELSLRSPAESRAAD